MLIPHSINTLSNFISAYYTDDLDICDKIIDYHKNSDNKVLGETATGVDKQAKDSSDVLMGPDMFDQYFNRLLKPAMIGYIEDYPAVARYANFGVKEPAQIQHYLPGGAFHAWHCERGTPKLPNLFRYMVYMTYLNTVEEEGETEWLHQNLKIKPEKGLTVIWPVDWPFTHRGIPSMSEHKYIVTGWWSFVSTKQIK